MAADVGVGLVDGLVDGPVGVGVIAVTAVDVAVHETVGAQRMVSVNAVMVEVVVPVVVEGNAG